MTFTKRFIKKIQPAVLDDLKKLPGAWLSSVSCENGIFESGDFWTLNGNGQVQMHFTTKENRRARLDFKFGTPFQGEEIGEDFPMSLVDIPSMPVKFLQDAKPGQLDLSDTSFAGQKKIAVTVSLQTLKGEDSEKSNRLKSIKVFHKVSEWHDRETPEVHIYDYVSFLAFETETCRKLIFKGDDSHPSFRLDFDNTECLDFHLNLKNGDWGLTCGQPLYRLVHVIE